MNLSTDLMEPFPQYTELAERVGVALLRDIEHHLGDYCFTPEQTGRLEKVPASFGGYVSTLGENSIPYSCRFRTSKGGTAELFFAVSPLCGRITVTMNCVPKSAGPSAFMRSGEAELLESARHFVAMYLGCVAEPS